MKTGNILNCQFSDLSKPEQDKLRDYLNQSQSDILIRVVKSLAAKELAEALNKAASASPSNSLLEAANLSLMKGQRYKIFLEVWDEVSGNTGNHQTVKLT